MTDLTNTPLPTLAERPSNSHKGDYGRALIVGGSLGMAGAPALAGMACLRSGVGLLSLGTPNCVQSTVAGFHPAMMTHGLNDNGVRITQSASDKLRSLLAGSDAAAFGPGLGRSNSLNGISRTIFRDTTCPLVIDADGLNALATKLKSIESAAGPRILTPHAGEFARLAGEPLTDPSDDAARLAVTSQFAASLAGETIVLLKGPRTVVTDGERYAINATGNPGMATGGSGDVLTGVITALLAQGLDAFDAARLGAHVHGLAGDLAAAKLGQIGMTAVDLIEFLPAAWQQVLKDSGG